MTVPFHQPWLNAPSHGLPIVSFFRIHKIGLLAHILEYKLNECLWRIVDCVFSMTVATEATRAVDEMLDLIHLQRRR